VIDRRARGDYWERSASAFLKKHGLRVLKSSYRCRFGELDLVCKDGRSLVVVEVRARSRSSYVSAVESVDAAKRNKLVQATRHLLMTHPQWCGWPLRFDVVAIDAADTPSPEFKWLRNAFELE